MTGTSRQPGVDRQQRTVEKPCQRDVLGVVGVRPPERVGDLPGGRSQSFGPHNLDGCHLEPLGRRAGELLRQLTPKRSLVQRTEGLGQDELRTDEGVLGQRIETGGLQAGLHDDARVDDEGCLQWPARDRRTRATALGIGSPVIVRPHETGSGSISAPSTVA